MYKRRQGIHPIALILILAIICVAATIVILLSMGYRYATSDKGDKFFGRVKDSQPITGTIRYRDGQTAKINYYKNTLEFSNGDIYTGDIYQFYRHGYGVMEYFATGDRYEGTFFWGVIHGKGTFTYRNGDTYDGDFEDGKMTGEGLYTWADGSSYSGTFQNGLPDGQGIFTFAAAPGTTAARYEGEFQNGFKNGRGTYYFDNGDVYIGHFQNDKRVGEGVYRWANGETYTGNFIDNKLDTRAKDGNGEFIMNPDGSFVHGDVGVYTWITGRSYTGYFENGKIVVVEDKE